MRFTGLLLLLFVFNLSFSQQVNVYTNNYEIPLNEGDTINTVKYKTLQVTIPYTDKVSKVDLLRIDFYADEFDPATCDVKKNVSLEVKRLYISNKDLIEVKYLSDGMLKVDIITSEMSDKENPLLKGYYDNFYVEVNGFFKTGEQEVVRRYDDGEVYAVDKVNKYGEAIPFGKSAVFQNGLRSHVLLFGKPVNKMRKCAIEYYESLGK